MQLLRATDADMSRHDDASERRGGGVEEALSKSSQQSGVGAGEVGLTAGMVVTVLAAVLLVAALIATALCLRRRRHQQTTTATTNTGTAHGSTRDGKEPSFIGFGSVRVLVNF